MSNNRISIFVPNLAKNKRKMIKIKGERVVGEDLNLCSQKYYFKKKNAKNLGRKGCG